MNNKTRTKTKVELVDKTPFLEALAVEYKQSLNECWKYYENELKKENSKLKKSGLAGFLYDVELNDWEDIGFFTGYLRGIDKAVELLSEAKPQRKKASGKK